MGFDVALAEEIWAAKYRYVPREGAADEDYTATAARVARAVAEAEAPAAREAWRTRFFDSIRDFGFIPAGRIIAGAAPDGRSRSSTASSWAPFPTASKGYSST